MYEAALILVQISPSSPVLPTPTSSVSPGFLALPGHTWWFHIYLLTKSDPAQLPMFDKTVCDKSGIVDGMEV